MNSPAITWRLRKFGRTWWSSLRTRSQPRWLAARAPIGHVPAKPQGPTPARADWMNHVARETDFGAEGTVRAATTTAPRSWLAASLV